jgi:hypothetical protein
LSTLKQLSIGVQTFSKLIEEEYVYVDKTQYIHSLLQRGSYYFLSRPRRFGKSLLISTLKELFAGRRELFANTFIGQSDYKWSENPIVHLDFSGLSSKSPHDFERDLLRTLQLIGASYTIDLSGEVSVARKTAVLIAELAKVNRVVVLIDEYDYPLLNNINNLNVADGCRAVLREFFTTLKTVDAHIKFIFVTGITKFSKTSIFSGLNNLKDISLDPIAAGLVGYTLNEIQSFFDEYLELRAGDSGKSREALLETIRFWYNGYQFSEYPLKVYNPFSVMLYLSDGKFLNYWFDTGTPTFLAQLIQEQNFPIFSLEHAEVNVAESKSYDFDQIELIPLLWQTGYLTIQSYNADSKNYTLTFPNEEVRTSFLHYIIKYLTGAQVSLVTNYSLELAHALKSNDLDRFFRTLQIFFSLIPYNVQIPVEKYYQSIFYVILNVLGLPSQTEVYTNDGRIDAVIETATHIYIIEFKIDKTAQQALEQIEKKGYAHKYHLSSKKIVLIGANFVTSKRNLENWIIKPAVTT